MDTLAGPTAWAAFLAVVLGMLALDLGVFHRRSHVVHFREAMTWSVIWIGVAALFGLVVWQWQGPTKGLEFATDIRETPPTIRTDPQRLQQVLKNLLANAFKFTEKGYVKLTIKAVEGPRRFFRSMAEGSTRYSPCSIPGARPRRKRRAISPSLQPSSRK